MSRGDLLMELAGVAADQEKRFPDQVLPSGTCAGEGEDFPLLPYARRDEERAKAHVAALVADDRVTWKAILDEEIAEAYAATNEEELRTELLQAAAIILRWAFQLDDGRDSRENWFE